MKKFINLLQNTSGATALEYALIAALISIAIIFTVTQVGKDILASFSIVASAIASSLR